MRKKGRKGAREKGRCKEQETPFSLSPPPPFSFEEP
jgi:hypothetical protein